MKVFTAATCLLVLAGCSAHISSDTPNLPNLPSSPNQSKVQQLQVGPSNQPASNTIQLGNELAAGGSVSFTWHADQSGALDIEPTSSVAINCDLSAAQPKVYLDSPSGSQELHVPQQVNVVAGTDYVVRFQFPANTCQGISLSFTVAWVASSVQKPAPSPSVPAPAPEAGFLGEEPLGASGGAIVVKNPQTDSVYRDYTFTTAQSQQIYPSAMASASSCAVATKLQLLEISPAGAIVESRELAPGSLRSIVPGKYYRLRWTANGVKGCSFVSESFNVGYL